MQAGVFNVTNHYEQSILRAGDAGFAPMSSAHYFKNIGTTDCYVVLIFNAGKFTNIDATFLVANMPAEVSHPNRRGLPYYPTVQLVGCNGRHVLSEGQS